MLVRNAVISAIAIVCGLASGCASEGPAPREQMAQARTLVEQADKADAQRYAPADVQRAHEELTSAQRNYDAKRYDEARADAESASADADVATARASAGAAQHAAAELARGNNVLRDETQRDAGGTAVQPPPQ